MNPGLTTRQKQVVKLLAEGWTRKRIAGLFGVSPKIVDFHVTQARKRLHMRENNLALLTKWAIKMGLTPL